MYRIAVEKLPENSIRLYKRRLIKKGKDASMENLNERVNSVADFKGSARGKRWLRTATIKISIVIEALKQT